MTKIIMVETHNTDRPESSWKRGAVRVPEGDRLIQRNGSKNVAEFIIESSTVDPDTGKRSSSWNRRNRGSATTSARSSARTSPSPSPGSTSNAKPYGFNFGQFHAHCPSMGKRHRIPHVGP